jgi:hypothetical protein
MQMHEKSHASWVHLHMPSPSFLMTTSSVLSNVISLICLSDLSSNPSHQNPRFSNRWLGAQDYYSNNWYSFHRSTCRFDDCWSMWPTADPRRISDSSSIKSSTEYSWNLCQNSTTLVNCLFSKNSVERMLIKYCLCWRFTFSTKICAWL